MKIAIATSLIMIFATFVAVSGYLFSTSKDASEPLSNASDIGNENKIQKSETPDRQVRVKTELPDYRPDDDSESKTDSSRLQVTPSMADSVVEVESSLKQRINLLNNDLGNTGARASLKAELSSPEMEAYKQAVVWRVKHENADLP